VRRYLFTIKFKGLPTLEPDLMVRTSRSPPPLLLGEFSKLFDSLGNIPLLVAALEVFPPKNCSFKLDTEKENKNHSGYQQTNQNIKGKNNMHRKIREKPKTKEKIKRQ